MDAVGFWAALSATAVPSALRGSSVLYALVNASHILAIGLLFGAIATLDARLLGAFGGLPVAMIAPPLVRVAATGVVLAVITGAMLFSVRPAEYAGNPAFLAKLGIVGLALCNLAVLHAGGPWRRALAGGPVGIPVRAAAAASLALWVGAILAGRWIAFVA